MKIVKILGGLGNQMFQYAFILALKKEGHVVKVDLTDFDSYTLHNGYELKSVFGIDFPQASTFELNLFLKTNRKYVYRILRKILKTKKAYWEENPEFFFHEHLFNNPKHQYLWGYWQHQAYITLVESELREAFTFPALSDEKNKSLAATLSDHNNTVSIHIRRGDYINHPALGGICDQRYYEQAISYFTQNTDQPLFVFFSNEIDWCKRQYGDLHAIFVDWNSGADSFRDMQLMSLCNHNIIANSSFSWWGAWLNDNPNKTVISPKKWINSPTLQAEKHGLILENFITL